MKIYKENATSITIAGQTFDGDGDGIIDVPAHWAGNAYNQGFVSAKTKLRELQQARSLAAQPAPQPASVDQPAATKDLQAAKPAKK